MISLNLLLKNYKKFIGVCSVITLSVSIIIASLIYIFFSVNISSSQLVEKYGQLSSVIYVNDVSSFNEIENKLNESTKVSKVVEKSLYIAETQGIKVMFHVFHFDDMSEINDIYTLDKKPIKAGNGIYIQNNEDTNKLNVTDIMEFEIENKIVQFPFGGYLDQDTYYEATSTKFVNIYIDTDLFENTVSSVKNGSQFYVALNNPTIENTYIFLQNFENYSSQNILDIKDLQTKQSNQSLIYGISFIMFGIIAIAYGGIYNFIKSIIEDNIVQISFFRTLGLPFYKSTKIYIQQVFYIGIYSQLLGTIFGTIIGNVVIAIQYNYSVYTFPKVWMIILTMIISTILPIYIITSKIAKTKHLSPVRLLLENKNMGYDPENDNIEKYIRQIVKYLAIYVISIFLQTKVNKMVYTIISCIQIFFILNFTQYLCIIILHCISKLSNKLLLKKPYVGLALKNISRNKTKISSVIGVLVLVMAFSIGMYNVFYTIRNDTVLKVEKQYNADIFISDYNQTDNVILQFISNLFNIEGVKHVNLAHSRYLSIDGNRIKGFFLSPNEYKAFFNLYNIETGEKSEMSDNKNQVIISESLAEKGNIKVGDKLTLVDNQVTYNVEIYEICDSIEYQGNTIYLNESNYNYIPNEISILLNPGVKISEAKQKINRLFDVNDVFKPNVISKEELKENYRKNSINGTMFIEIILVAIITAGVLMLVNQQSQFIKDRNKEYALYKVLYSGSSEINIILFVENICILVVGLFGGIFSGILVTSRFVNTATFTAGIADVFSYHYNLKALAFINIYIITLYSFSLIISAYYISKSFSIYSLKNE